MVIMAGTVCAPKKIPDAIPSMAKYINIIIKSLYFSIAMELASFSLLYQNVTNKIIPVSPNCPMITG